MLHLHLCAKGRNSARYRAELKPQ